MVLLLIPYSTPSFLSMIHSYGTHTTTFGLLLLHYYYISLYDALGIYTAFSIHINLPSFMLSTSVIYSLWLRWVTLLLLSCAPFVSAYATLLACNFVTFRLADKYSCLFSLTEPVTLLPLDPIAPIDYETWCLILLDNSPLPTSEKLKKLWHHLR